MIVLEPARKVWVDVRYPVLRRRPHRRPRGLERLGVHGHAAQGAGRAEGVGGEGDAAAPAGAALVRVDGVRVVRVHGEGVRVGGLAHRGVGGVAAEDGGNLIEKYYCFSLMSCSVRILALKTTRVRLYIGPMN